MHKTIISLLSSIILFTCCAEKITPHPNKDETPPILQSFLPTNGAVDQPLNVRIELYFDEFIQPASCNSNTIYITKEGETAKIAIKQYLTPADNITGALHLYLATNLEPNTSYQVTLNGGPINQGEQPFTGTNWLFRTGNAPITYSPKLSIASPSNNQFCKESIQLTGTISNAQKLEYMVNSNNSWITITPDANNNWQTSSHAVSSYPFQEGTNTITLKATSKYGTTFNTITNIQLVVDTQAPTVRITSHTTGAYLYRISTIKGTATDLHLEHVEITIYDSQPHPITIIPIPWTKTSGTTNWTFPVNLSLITGMVPLTYNIKTRAIDKAGHISFHTIPVILMP